MKREENTLTKFEVAVKETEDMMERMFGEGRMSTLQSEETQLISPNLSELQKLLDRLQKDGMIVHLTNRVLNLGGELKTIQSFDCRA